MTEEFRDLIRGEVDRQRPGFEFGFLPEEGRPEEWQTVVYAIVKREKQDDWRWVYHQFKADDTATDVVLKVGDWLALYDVEADKGPFPPTSDWRELLHRQGINVDRHDSVDRATTSND